MYSEHPPDLFYRLGQYAFVGVFVISNLTCLFVVQPIPSEDVMDATMYSGHAPDRLSQSMHLSRVFVINNLTCLFVVQPIPSEDVMDATMYTPDPFYQPSQTMLWLRVND